MTEPKTPPDKSALDGAINGIAESHHARQDWQRVMSTLRHEMSVRQVHPSQTVVLVPYAQLMQPAREAWRLHTPGGAGAAYFVPRFETSQNWTHSLGGFEPSGDDLRSDAALDVLTAAKLLKAAGLAAHQSVLAPRVMQAAWSLMGTAAAQPPEDRSAWGQRLAGPLGAAMDTPVLALEAAVGRIALAWAANSDYLTDMLFAAAPHLLVVLEGFQMNPLARALAQRLGERALVLPLDAPFAGQNPPAATCALHQALDAEDEAQLAAACVLNHLAQGRSPVALVAVDRQLTRRVRAMLDQGDGTARALAVRDETGWKLSTTRAAATLMGLLRACAWDAPADAVLDWLKNAPAFDARQVTQLEMQQRKSGAREWRSAGRSAPRPSPSHAGSGAAQAELPALTQTSAPANPQASPHDRPHDRPDALDDLRRAVDALRDTLGKSRVLSDWLASLQAALGQAGHWQPLAQDGAGRAVLAALHLNPDAFHPNGDAPDPGQAADLTAFTQRLSQSEFTAWVSQTLEAASYHPAHPANAQVVILPLGQLLGRDLTAVVLPGCDEVRLPVSPEPPGDWTPAQRELLGLPSRGQLAQANCQAWQYALKSPQLDVLWRTSEGGETLMASGLVQSLRLDRQALESLDGQKARDAQTDPRTLRTLHSQLCAMPAPSGQALPVTRLSASAYDDLRTCPYRFFALRQLKLQEADELDAQVDKRDFGNWLHLLLKRFHEALKQTQVPDVSARLVMLDVAALQARDELDLSGSEFLPFAAVWPQVRTAYLKWLAGHEATGAVYEEGEAWKEMPLGGLTLFGKIDRVDRVHSAGQTTHAQVIDYKTEGKTATVLRIKSGAEDTQLAFYAALLHDDTLQAAYVNIGEKEATKTYTQPDIVHLRDQLLEGILDDIGRIGQGAALPALGEGKACDFCAARGLCRKDFWS